MKTILVVGPDALEGGAVGGGSAGVKPVHLVSPLEGISTVAGDSVGVSYIRGIPTLAELAGRTKFTTEPSGSKAGVTVESFNNLDLSGSPEKTSVQSHINFTGTGWATLAADISSIAEIMGMASEPHHSLRRITGYYRADTTGKYLLPCRVLVKVQATVSSSMARK